MRAALIPPRRSRCATGKPTNASRPSPRRLAVAGYGAGTSCGDRARQSPRVLRVFSRAQLAGREHRAAQCRDERQRAQFRPRAFGCGAGRDARGSRRPRAQLAAFRACRFTSPAPALPPMPSSETLPPPRKAAAAEHGEAALLYTSGTTGKPKGCILTNEYFLEAGRLYTSLGGYCRFDGADDRLATPLPVTHMNALAVSFMAMLETRGCLIQLDRFHPSHLVAVPAREPRDRVSLSRRHAGDVAQGASRAGRDAAGKTSLRLRRGRRPAPPCRLRGAIRRAPDRGLGDDGDGRGRLDHRERGAAPRRRALFRQGAPRALPIGSSDEAGIDVAPGAAGELLVRREGADPRRGFFSGYYKDARATDEAWAGGWFHTGDLVRVGADGAFFFVDRSKNVVRRSGENIAAVEVESALGTHPDVAGSAVCPVRDEMRGEEVFAFVVLRPGAAPTLETASALQAPLSRGARLLQGARLCRVSRGAAADRLAEARTRGNQGARGTALAARGSRRGIPARLLLGVPAEAARLGGPGSAGSPAVETGVFDLRHLKRRRG